MILIVLLANALTSNAQINSYYHKLLKGQPSPFDTAVAIQISRYRQESIQLRWHRELTDSLKNEIASLHLELKTSYQQNAINNSLFDRLAARDARRDSVNQQLKTSIDKMFTTVDAMDDKKIGLTEYGIATVIVLLLLNLLFN